ncbi:hypothetical protein BH11CYA1_BH11CYA1_19620 [soil metagenome]
MQRISKFVSIIALSSIVVSSLLVPLCSPAIAAPKSELIITQLDNVIFLTDEAVRIKNNTGKFILISKAPDWKITCFRTDRKICWQTDLEKFTGVMLLNAYITPKGPPSATFLGEKKYKGFDCRCYKDKKGHLVYGAKNIKIPTKVAELLCRFLFVPDIKEIPLFEGSTIEDKYREKDWFDAHRYKDFLQRTPVSTRSISTKPYDAKDFVVPPGLKKTTMPTDVSYSDKNKNDLEGMLEGVGFMGKEK